MLHVTEGPAGSGKSQHARSLLAAGTVDLLADTTSIWAAVGGYERDPLTGKYPVRLDDDPALDAALYIQTTVVRYGLSNGLNVAATTSRRGQIPRWQSVADEFSTGLIVETIDPGRAVVAQRLSDADGNLSAECEKAINRWY